MNNSPRFLKGVMQNPSSKNSTDDCGLFRSAITDELLFSESLFCLDASPADVLVCRMGYYAMQQSGNVNADCKV